MIDRPRPRTALVGAVTALALAAVTVLGPAMPTPPASADRVADAAWSVPAVDLACGDSGLVVAAVLDGDTLCTTGPEPGERAPAAGAPVAEASAGIQCYGDGAGGPRVQLVYAHPPSVNRLSSLRPTMVTRAAQMEAIFAKSAAQTGGQRHIRWATDANCNLTVLDVTVDATAIPSTNFTALINAMVAKGHSDPNRKYVIWAETNSAVPSVCAGLATLWYDDRPFDLNWNDSRTGFARLDETCLRSVFDGRTEAHELMHTIGGIQHGAPSATPYGHCRDESDRMCYDDDGSGPVRMRSRCGAANELRFDCGNDDYFYANAPCGAGGWLASHWNTADSRWLEAMPASATAPPGNDRPASATRLSGYSGTAVGTNVGATIDNGERTPVAKPGGRSVWFSWTAPVSGPITFDTCGSDTDTLLGVYTGSPSSVTSLVVVGESDDDTQLGQQSRVTFNAVAGTTYLIDVDGQNGDQGKIALRWGAPYHGYPDVRLGASYEAAVNWSKRFGLLDAQPGGGFGPKVEMTRGQVVNLLWRLVDRPRATTGTSFSDVPAGAWYRLALDWAVGEGVASGYPNNTFRPGATVKRGQLVTMLWNLAGNPTGRPAAGFTDVAPTSKLSAALDWAASEGLVGPYRDGSFRPTKTVTRQQIVTVLYAMATRTSVWAAYPDPPPSTAVFAR